MTIGEGTGDCSCACAVVATQNTAIVPTSDATPYARATIESGARERPEATRDDLDTEVGFLHLRIVEQLTR
jgi:hypothetical protein